MEYPKSHKNNMPYNPNKNPIEGTIHIATHFVLLYYAM